MDDFLLEGRRVQLLHAGTGGPVLFWAAGAGDRAEEMQRAIQALSPAAPFTLFVFSADDWNGAFSPWPAPAVFGREAFPGGGPQTLAWLLSACLPAVESVCGARRRFLGGYSLAGLFSLWALYESGAFCGAASCSGSLWFPGWQEYASAHSMPDGSAVYLSLGDAEERTRNAALRTVGDATRAEYERLLHNPCVRSAVLEWNPGGHFQNPLERTARGFAWLLQH